MAEVKTTAPALNQIITGDCRDVMKTIPDEFAEMIVTSPPYNVGLKYDGFDDNLSEQEFRDFNHDWLLEAFRISKDTSRMYVAVSDNMFWWFREVAESVGWTYAQKLTWCKPNFVSRGRRISNDWNYMSEDILLFRKGERTPMLSHRKVTTHNWAVIAVPQSNYNESRIPAQMPFSLCFKLIARTPGDIVLDPFCGSGQVLRAAKALGRSYLGIELVPGVAKKARSFVSGTRVLNKELQEDQIHMFSEAQK